MPLKNLDYLRNCGVDAFWLDIKAYNPDKHKWLTGCSNEAILKLPEEIIERGFVLEVLSLYIPNLIEAEELENIARILKETNPSIPFTVLAFFPEYRMKHFDRPSVEAMIDVYNRIKAVGLKNVRLGNVGVFAPTEKDQQFLLANVDKGAF